MARFLIASLPLTGHNYPPLPIASKLVERGHEVRWYSGRKFQRRIEATGAQFEPYRTAYDYDDRDMNAAFPDRVQAKGFKQMNIDFINVFMNPIVPHCNDIRAILNEFPADVLLADGAVWAASCVHEKGGPPYAVYCETCLGIDSRDTAPFGTGMLPSFSRIGHVRNRLLRFMASNILFRATSAELARQRAVLGLPPRKFSGVEISPYLLLEATVPGFEYPLSDIPPQVHFVGALLGDPPTDRALPSWWDDVTSDKRPVVLVTQGTLSTDPKQLIAPTIAGLATEDVLVVVAGASPESLGLATIPSNVRIAPFIPFGIAMPHARVFVTNGGFGGVHFALSHGVPLVVAGGTEEKPEIANRLMRNGAGLNLKTGSPTPEQVRNAVNEVLHASTYREHARRLQAELTLHDGPTESALLLEQLAETGQPVVTPVTTETETISNAAFAG